MMKIRDALFRQFKLTKSQNDLKAYKQFRNRIFNEIRENKKNYYHRYFDEHKNNMKMLWKGIKSIISIKTGSFDSVRFLKDENGSRISVLPRLLFTSRLAVRSTAYYVLTRDDPIGYFNPLLTAINQIHYMNTP